MFEVTRLHHFPSCLNNYCNLYIRHLVSPHLKIKLPNTRPNKKANFSKNKTNIFVVQNGLERKEGKQKVYISNNGKIICCSTNN